MSATTVSIASGRTPVRGARITLVVSVVLAAWLVLVFILGANNAFVQPIGAPPLPILLGFATPIAIFVTAFRLSPVFRDFVLRFDISLAVGIQAWRFAGLGFLALYTYKVLPGVFAWPAGLGDIAIGVTAIWALVALARRPGFATSRAFVIWNLLGLLDLAVAVGTGTLVASRVIDVGAEVSTGVMATLPLVLIPAYLVPLFVMLHVTALLQVRNSRA